LLPLVPFLWIRNFIYLFFFNFREQLANNLSQRSHFPMPPTRSARIRR
jgi:hypothetical protein